MSDKCQNKDLPTSTYSFLKKKIKRFKRRLKQERSFDINRYKERILNKLAVDFSIDKSISTLGPGYDQMMKMYLSSLTFSVCMLINRIVMCDSVPLKVRCREPLQEIMIGIAKEVLLNEYELLNFAIYLDKLGWEPSDQMATSDYLFAFALAVKMKLNCEEDTLPIISHFQQNRPGVLKGLEALFGAKGEELDKHSITQREMNTKYCILSQASNPFCKNNAIDYNCIVDQILKLSLPYESKTSGKEKKRNEKQSEVQYQYVYASYPYYPYPYSPAFPQYHLPPYYSQPLILNQPVAEQSNKSSLLSQQEHIRPMYVMNETASFPGGNQPGMKIIPQPIYVNPVMRNSEGLASPIVTISSNVKSEKSMFSIENVGEMKQQSNHAENASIPPFLVMDHLGGYNHNIGTENEHNNHLFEHEASIGPFNSEMFKLCNSRPQSFFVQHSIQDNRQSMNNITPK